MDILILTNFTSTFSESDNDRFLYLAKMLAKENNVEIVTSDFCHEKKKHRNQPEYNWPFKITFLHEPGYPKNVCLKRFYSHFIWGRSVKKYLFERKIPDVIYCAVPSLSGPFEASEFCKKRQIPFIIDVQDLWPEAFQMVFKVPVISSLIFLPFNILANKIYTSADEIVAVSKTYADRATKVNKKEKNAHVVFLGTKLRTFDKNDKNDIPYYKGAELWLAYCGTLGSSYDLICVFDALDNVKRSGNTPPKFIIMGDGPQKEKFEEYAKSLGIDALFTGRIPYDQMCAILSKCDITVNPIVHGSAGSIINKHADYAASGLPVVNTQDSIEYRNLINQYKMGFNCNNGDAKDLADKLIILINNDLLRQTMGEATRKCAEEKFDRECTYEEIISLLTMKREI